jgi:hypothetical protein
MLVLLPCAFDPERSIRPNIAHNYFRHVTAHAATNARSAAPLRYAIAGPAGSRANGGFNQLASLSSADAVASRSAGAASTPYS